MFNMFPYLNLHKINLDYIIKTVEQAVSTVQQSVERIEAALGAVNGLTGRVEALEAATQQLSSSVESLDTRVNGAYRRLEVLEPRVEDVDERVSALYRRIGTMADDVAGKALLPIIVNLSADDAFPAQIPEADQAQVRAALAALLAGTGAAQARINQQMDQALPASFTVRLSYVGDGILTGILSQAIYNGTAQEYIARITTVSINSRAMTWEMASHDVAPGLDHVLRYDLQTLTPDAQRQARVNISAAYTGDVAPKAIQLTATMRTETAGTWSGATWATLLAHARAGGVIVVDLMGTKLAFLGGVPSNDSVINTPAYAPGRVYNLFSNGNFTIGSMS